MTFLAFISSLRHTPPPETSSPLTDPTDGQVVLRFLTQGAATVELHRDQWDTSYRFNWRCLGCNTVGGGGPYGLQQPRGYIESEPTESRHDANQHATACRAMPQRLALIDANLDTAARNVGEAVSRADGKANVGLAFVVPVAAALATGAATLRLPPATHILGALAGLGLAAAAVLLLLTLLPRRTGPDGQPPYGTFLHIARLRDENDLLKVMAKDNRCADLLALSALADYKFWLLRWAGYVTLAVVVLLVLAAAAAL